MDLQIIIDFIYLPFAVFGAWLKPWLIYLLVDSLGAPAWVAELIMYVIGVSVVVIFATLTMMFLTWLERKVIARIQDRVGPNRVGKLGLLQPVADMVKLFTKELIVPTNADRVVYFLAPAIFVMPAFMVMAVLPFAKDGQLADLNIGFLYIAAIGSTSTIGLLMAGWSSNNKYSLLGGMRAVAQFVSYEIPQVLSVVGVLMLAGTLKLGAIVEQQYAIPYFILQPVAALIFLIASISEVNRTPFDLPEAESEIIAGYQTEYGAIGFALYSLAEFINMFVVAAFAATLFLGGWNWPSWPAWGPIVPGWLGFILKSYLLVFVLMWLRGTLPRLRVDQLMEFAWKALVPLTLANLLLTGVGLSIVDFFTQWFEVWAKGGTLLIPVAWAVEITKVIVFLYLNGLLASGFLTFFKLPKLEKRAVVLVSRAKAAVPTASAQ
jgi:NADH-quinone oxidoreductase subunit H